MVSSASIRELFASFNGLTVTVAGDIMADTYIEGKVERISPEAPVPVVEVVNHYTRLGGAGNVAINLRALGAKVNLCSVIGADENGKILTRLLAESGIDTRYLHTSPHRMTTGKTRVLGNHQQMLRVDQEQTHFLSADDEAACLQRLQEAIGTSDALLFEDYDKGYLTEALIAEGTKRSNEKNIPVTVDPKIRHFFAYPNVTLFKPNLKELRTGLQIPVDAGNTEELNAAAAALRQRLNHRYTLITLSEHGVYGEENGSDFRIPAHVRNIADVSGAGDTVIAVATLCLAAGADFKLTAALANLAGGIACEYPGVMPVNKENLLEEALERLIDF